MSLDPGELVVAVDEGAERLEKAADAYYTAVKRFEEAENEYEMAMAKGRTDAYHNTDERTKKPPAEDVRNSMALMSIDPEVRTEYAAARAEKEALSVRYRALAAAVSARQSLLGFMRGVS